MLRFRMFAGGRCGGWFARPWQHSEQRHGPLWPGERVRLPGELHLRLDRGSGEQDFAVVTARRRCG